MKQFVITNVSIYKAIAIGAHAAMHELTNGGRRPKDDGSLGWIVTFDPEQKSFTQAMIAIVFAGMWLEAFLHLRIVRDHGLMKFKEYDFKSYDDTRSKGMNLRQQLQRRDFWLHLDFNIGIAVVVAVTLITYVVSRFVG